MNYDTHFRQLEIIAFQNVQVNVKDVDVNVIDFYQKNPLYWKVDTYFKIELDSFAEFYYCSLYYKIMYDINDNYILPPF